MTENPNAMAGTLSVLVAANSGRGEIKTYRMAAMTTPSKISLAVLLTRLV